MRPTYANVMSTVAVFIAMGGTSYAVASLPKGSVGEPQLRKSAVTGEKVKDGSLTSADLAAGTLQSGPRGPRGADGPTGANGPTGAAGPTGPSDAWHTNGISLGNLSREADQHTVVAQLTNLPPGSYVFHSTVSIVAHEVGVATNPGTAVTTFCGILTNGELQGASVGLFGTPAGATRAGALTPMGSAVMKDGFQVTLECWNSGPTATIPAPANVPSFQQVGLDAIRVGTLH